jgi:chaperonin cofactor prefoldin
MTAAGLRERLEALALHRQRLEAELREVRRDTGKVLLEVQEDKDVSLQEAATILALSRPTLYCLIHDAEAR